MKRTMCMLLALVVFAFLLPRVNADGFICKEMTEYSMNDLYYSVPSTWVSDLTNTTTYYHYEKKPTYGLNSGYIAVVVTETGIKEATFTKEVYSEFAKGMFGEKKIEISIGDLQGYQFCTFADTLENVYVVVGLLNDNGTIYMISYANPKETKEEVHAKFEELKSTIHIGTKSSFQTGSRESIKAAASVSSHTAMETKTAYSIVCDHLNHYFDLIDKVSFPANEYELYYNYAVTAIQLKAIVLAEESIVSGNNDSAAILAKYNNMLSSLTDIDEKYQAGNKESKDLYFTLAFIQGYVQVILDS